MASTPANSLNVQEPGFALFDGTANFYSPNKVLVLVDDFIANVNSPDGQLVWNVINGFTAISGTLGHPGVLQSTADASTRGMALTDSFNRSNFVLGGGKIYVNFVVALNTLSVSGNYLASIGLCDPTAISSPGLIPPTDGVYFTYTDNVASGKWLGTCTKSSVSSVQASPVFSATTGYVNLGIIIDAAGTSVSFFVNGVSNGDSITTNIPTVAITPFILFQPFSGNGPDANFDLFYMTQVLNTAR